MKKLIVAFFLLGSIFSKAQAPADANALKTYIDANIVTNGSGGITGQKLNNALNGFWNLAIPNRTITQVRAGTVNPGTPLYTTNTGQEGYWYYDGADVTSTDNTGTILVDAGGGRWKRIFTGDVYFDWFGAKGDGSTDNAAALALAVPAASGRSLIISKGNFKLNSLDSFDLINTNILGYGDSVSQFSGNFGYALIQFLTVRHAKVDGIWFNNTYVNATQGSTGTIFISHKDCIDFTFTHNRINCPTANTDALSFQINIGDSTVTQHLFKDVYVTNNKFINIGRIAVDVFNRKFDAIGYTQAQNIHVDNNFSDSTGTQGSFGLFTSFDGAGQFCSASGNTIKNALNAGIEWGDYNNSKIQNNNFIYTTRPFIPLEFDPAYPVYYVEVSGNNAPGTNTYSTIFNVNNSTFHDNKLNGSINTSANDGIVYVWGCNNNTFVNETYTSSTCAMKVTSSVSGRYPGITSTGNKWINCTFIGAPGQSSRALVSFDSTLTTNNTISDCIFTKGSDSSYVRQFASASGNNVYHNLQNGTWGSWSADPIDAPIASPTFTGVPKVPTATLGTNTTQAASTAFVLANATGTFAPQNEAQLMETALTTTLKFETLWKFDKIHQATTLSSGYAFYYPIIVTTSQTISGIMFYQATQGNYTAASTNQIGLYTLSGTTLTLVASSVDSGGLFKNTANTFVKKNFSSTYNVSPGVYYAAFCYNNSAQVTAPTMGGDFNLLNAVAGGLDFTGTAGVALLKTSTTSLPSTITATTIPQAAFKIWLGLY